MPPHHEPFLPRCIDQLAFFKYNQMQSDAEQEMDFLAQDQCYAVEEKVGIETIDFDNSS